MITSTQAQQYLDQALGVGVPSFLVEAAIAVIAATETAMDEAGYDELKKLQLQLISVTLIASIGAPRQVTSQHAPSGASRSFKYSSTSISDLRRLLFALDTAGVLVGLIPADPAPATLFMVV